MEKLTRKVSEGTIPTKIGLVLAGGGGKGAYHVGVWKALKEYGLDLRIMAISGTSVGALNAALFTSTSINEAANVWSAISPDKILSFNVSGMSRTFHRHGFDLPLKIVERFAGRGVFSREGLTRIIKDSVNLSDINKDSMLLYATAYDEKLRRPHYFLLNQLNDEDKLNALLASSALPFIFDPVKIDGQTYWDGGLIDNTPVLPLYDLGCPYIIVVHLNRMTVIDHSKYPGAKIIEIFPKSSLGEFVDGTLDFNSSNANKRMIQGYADANDILKPIFSMIDTQKEVLNSVSRYARQEKTTFDVLKSRLNDRQQIKENLKEVLHESE